MITPAAESPRKILIVKPSSLGDVVHALPTLQALRRAFPDAEIDWLVKRQWAGILERAEGLHRMWTVDRGLGGWLSVVPTLRAARFDLVLDLQGLFRSAAISRLTGCDRIVGFANGREGSPFWYTERVPVPTVEMHAIDRYLRIAAAVGAPPPAIVEFGLSPTDEDREKIRRLLLEHGLIVGTPWIAINPAARWQTKRWAAEHFAQVANDLQGDGAARVVLIGGSEDRAASAAVASRMSTPPIDLTGSTPLVLLPAVLEMAALLLTNDSGPMHIAAAVKTPVVAVFGPTSEIRTGPYGREHRVLSVALPCRPCFSRRCDNAVPLACLSAITPEAVVESVRSQLALRLAH